MKIIILKKRAGRFLCLIGVFLILCDPTSPDQAGNVSQTGNGMVAGIVYETDGATPASDAYVYLRKKNAVVDISDILTNKFADTIAIARTNSDGEFTIDSIDTGLYVIECTDGGNNFALNDSVPLHYFDSTVILLPAVLKPAGAIKGSIRLSEGGDPRKVFVLMVGIDRYAIVDTNGRFKFERLAEGDYSLRIHPTLDNYAVFDTTDIRVKSADTTDIGVVTPLFTDIPTIKNLTLSYDTLKQRVTLHWSKPDTSIVKSVNVYRGAVDSMTAFFTQLNFFPVMDTAFIDSLCVQNKTYEYRVAAVDAHAAEGVKSAPVKVRIALYEIAPKNVLLVYDTLRQTVTLRWSNSDTALVKSYNVYRRNINLNEKFWTPFNNSPITDTAFIDSAFLLCPTGDFSCGDSIGLEKPSYEYCVAAIIKNVREGVRSAGMPVRICLDYLTPKNVDYLYDTLKQTVSLRWSKPDMTIVQGFSVFRKNTVGNDTSLAPISDALLSDTVFIDSLGEQNQTYEYRIVSIVGNNRAKVMSAKVRARIVSLFIERSEFRNFGYGPEQLCFPNDIAVSLNGDMYIVDQGNHRVQVFDSVMQYKRQIGAGILQYPLKVSIDEPGHVFVANYDVDQDEYSIFIFDSSGSPVDTIADSTELYDIDVRDSLLYVAAEGRPISMYSFDGDKRRSWRYCGQDVKWIVAGEANRIFVSTGMVFPDKNKVIVFDSLGSVVTSMVLPYYPYALAFDTMRQLLYVVCYSGAQGSILHVMDKNNVEKANYKIKSTDQNISIGLQKNGAVLLVLRGEGKIVKLKPLFE
jgi:hypothetical protein